LAIRAANFQNIEGQLVFHETALDFARAVETLVFQRRCAMRQELPPEQVMEMGRMWGDVIFQLCLPKNVSEDLIPRNWKKT